MYSIIQPPFTLKFDEMSKADLKAYYKWFMEAIPRRTAELADAIREKEGFQKWRPDNSPSSLEMLGKWFSGEVEVRERTAEEIPKLAGPSGLEIELPGPELTNRTFSLAMDIGMYLSQVFLKNHPSLKWNQPFGSRRFVDYGQPVLIEFTSAPFNPVAIVVRHAYGLANRTNKRSLRDVYDIWSKMAVK